MDGDGLVGDGTASEGLVLFRGLEGMGVMDLCGDEGSRLYLGFYEVDLGFYGGW